jgi:hypothetical protein
MFPKNDNMGIWTDWNLIDPDINFENITLLKAGLNGKYLYL